MAKVSANYLTHNFYLFFSVLASGLSSRLFSMLPCNITQTPPPPSSTRSSDASSLLSPLSRNHYILVLRPSNRLLRASANRGRGNCLSSGFRVGQGLVLVFCLPAMMKRRIELSNRDAGWRGEEELHSRSRDHFANVFSIFLQSEDGSSAPLLVHLARSMIKVL